MIESHDSPAAGHVGFFKTYYNARQSFYWKGMYKYIQKYVVECDTFQRNKSKNVMTLGLLHPLHITTQKWEEISMDFIEELPLSDNKDKIFVVVDRLIKYAHFIGIKKLTLLNKMLKCSVKIFIDYMGFQKSL